MFRIENNIFFRGVIMPVQIRYETPGTHMTLVAIEMTLELARKRKQQIKSVQKKQHKKRGNKY